MLSLVRSTVVEVIKKVVGSLLLYLIQKSIPRAGVDKMPKGGTKCII